MAARCPRLGDIERGRALAAHRRAIGAGTQGVIAQVRGKLLAKELDRVEIITQGGIGYELSIPLSVYESLPKLGEDARCTRTWSCGRTGGSCSASRPPSRAASSSASSPPRASGRPLALGMMSTLTAETARARDPREGRRDAAGRPARRAEEGRALILDLADKLDDVQVDVGGIARPDGAGADDAVRALVSLGYASVDAEKAVRGASMRGTRALRPGAHSSRAVKSQQSVRKTRSIQRSRGFRPYHLDDPHPS